MRELILPPSTTDGDRVMTNTNELVINFHMTETCNYRCDYCYATWDTGCHSQELHRKEGAVESLIDRLADYFLSNNPLKQAMTYSSVRLNFAGGEPMLLGNRFSDALLHAKSKGFRTSIITNAAFLYDECLLQLSRHIDVLGVSFDTADAIIAGAIGRMDRKGNRVDAVQLVHISTMYRQLNPYGLFKVNTVVNEHNHHELLVDVMTMINPDKWKMLRVLPIYEHIKPITDAQFNGYVERHSLFSHLSVVEDNSDMKSSYLMINPEGCFYQNGGLQEGYSISEPILSVGVQKAFSEIHFDSDVFFSRYNQGIAHV
jgi:radical S-adenosyl methionine domain-containing protein 2